MRVQQQVKRGVHELSFYAKDGAVILVAIDRQGRKLGELHVYDDDGYNAALFDLGMLLAAADPQPRQTPPWTLIAPSPALSPA